MHAYLISFQIITRDGFGFCNRIVALTKPPTSHEIREHEAELLQTHPAHPRAVVALSVSVLGD